MHRRHQFIRLVCLCCALLMTGIELLSSTSTAAASPVAQSASGRRYVPRPVPIRRLPTGRVLRIVSRTHGGFANRVCMLESLDEQGVSFRTPNMGDEAMSAPVIFLPGSGQLASAINPAVVCVLTSGQPVEATALAPDGETVLPALVVPEGRISIVSLPIEAFTMPGDWQLEIAAPVSAAFPITVPPLAQPSLTVSGDALLMQGYQPGEELRGVMMANRCMTGTIPGSDPPVELSPIDDADMARCADGEVGALLEPVQVFDVVADELGAALVQRIDPEQDLIYAIVGATTPQLLSNISFGEDLDEALADGGFPVERTTLFQADDQDENQTLNDKVDPTPEVLPSTGVGMSDGAGAYGAGAIVLLVLMAVGASTRMRASARKRTG